MSPEKSELFCGECNVRVTMHISGHEIRGPQEAFRTLGTDLSVSLITETDSESVIRKNSFLGKLQPVQ